MADHSLRSAQYVLKSMENMGKPVNTEETWQNEQQPPEIEDLVLSARE